MLPGQGAGCVRLPWKGVLSLDTRVATISESRQNHAWKQSRANGFAIVFPRSRFSKPVDAAFILAMTCPCRAAAGVSFGLMMIASNRCSTSTSWMFPHASSSGRGTKTPSGVTSIVSVILLILCAGYQTAFSILCSPQGINTLCGPLCVRTFAVKDPSCASETPAWDSSLSSA